ncbi:MAG: ATP synthase F0 subunit C [Bacteroidota bacterium]
MEYIAKAAAAIGVGLIILAVAYGMGKTGKAAMEAIARQPQSSDKITGAMIVVLGLIEGAALFGIIVCLLIVVRS